MRYKQLVLIIVMFMIILANLPVLAKSGIHITGIGDGLAMVPKENGSYELWQVDKTDKQIRRLSKELDVTNYLASPDGKEIAILASPSGHRSGNAYLVTLATGKIRKITESLRGERLLSWRPGHRQLVVSRWPKLTDGDGGVWSIDIETGRLSKLIDPCDADFPMASKAVFDKSGNRLAVMRGGRYVAVFDFNRPNLWRRLPFYSSAIQDVEWLDSDHLVIALIHGKSIEFMKGSHGSFKQIPANYAGGVWIWDLSKNHNLVPPQDADMPYQPSITPLASGLQLIGQKGETIYSVGVNPSNHTIVYIAQSGLYIADTLKQHPTQILAVKDVPGLMKLKKWYTVHEDRGIFYSWEFAQPESFVYLRVIPDLAPEIRKQPIYRIDLNK